MNRLAYVYRNAAAIGEATGASYRQLDYWARTGLLGDDVREVGSGGNRVWTAAHMEIAWALVRCSPPAVTIPAGALLPIVADAVRARRVNPAGKWLVVPLDGSAQRHGHLCLDELTGFDAARVIRLKSFAADTNAQPVSA